MPSTYFDNKRLHKTINIFMVFIVITSIALTIIESVERLMTPGLRNIFLSIHLSILLVFFAELLYRFWSVSKKSHHNNAWKNRLYFLLHPLTIIDIIVLVPLFTMIWTHDLHNADFVVLRLLRFTSLLNIFRFYRSSRVLLLLKTLWHEIWYEILVFGIISIQCVIIAGTLFFVSENGVNPQVRSIGDGIWWSIVTLTTIGYGDIYPFTTGWRIIAWFLAFFGIGLVALPTGILASGFMKALRAEKRLEQVEEMVEDEALDINLRLKRIEKKLHEITL